MWSGVEVASCTGCCVEGQCKSDGTECLMQSDLRVENASELWICSRRALAVPSMIIDVFNFSLKISCNWPWSCCIKSASNQSMLVKVLLPASEFF